MMLKLTTLKQIPVQDSEGKPTTLLDQTSNGLVCLMLASKVQDSDIHLKVSNVV